MLDGDHTLGLLQSFQHPAGLYPPLLSPPEGSSASPTPPLPTVSTLDLPLAGPSPTQSPAVTQQTPPPSVPQVPVWQPTPRQVLDFDYCPFTRHGLVCGYTSWSCSANKQIKRHMKAEHFPDTSLGYECPNSKCASQGYRFLRKDAYNAHRKVCNLIQAPNYVPLPDIVSGSDVEVDRWMRARHRQRRTIVAKLRSGTPWSGDLLESVSL